MIRPRNVRKRFDLTGTPTHNTTEISGIDAQTVCMQYARSNNVSRGQPIKVRRLRPLVSVTTNRRFEIIDHDEQHRHDQFLIEDCNRDSPDESQDAPSNC